VTTRFVLSARAGVVVGGVLIVLGFCLGVDTPISTTVAGQSYHCADVITPGMLVSGQSNASGPDLRTPAEHRLSAQIEAACSPLEQRAEWAVWGSIALGGLVVLAGWTALREHEHDVEVAARCTVPAGV
jgi:hypothetical protein